MSFSSVDMTSEEYNLFNPAYCGYLIYSCINEFQSNSNGKYLPCSIAYLIIPLLMTKNISETFPRSVSTSFLSWVNENQQSIVNIHIKFSDYLDISDAAILFLIESNVIGVDKGGCLYIKGKKITKNPSFFKDSSTMLSHLKLSKFLGKWLNKYAPSSIYSILGIRP